MVLDAIALQICNAAYCHSQDAVRWRPLANNFEAPCEAQSPHADAVVGASTKPANIVTGKGEKLALQANVKNGRQRTVFETNRWKKYEGNLTFFVT